MAGKLGHGILKLNIWQNWYCDFCQDTNKSSFCCIKQISLIFFGSRHYKNSLLTGCHKNCQIIWMLKKQDLLEEYVLDKFTRLCLSDIHRTETSLIFSCIGYLNPEQSICLNCLSFCRSDIAIVNVELILTFLVLSILTPTPTCAL